MADITEIIDRLGSLAKEATPGPWEVAPKELPRELRRVACGPATIAGVEYAARHGVTYEQSETNAAFIAAANPAAILSIIAAYREQAAELAALREKLRKLEEQEPVGWVAERGNAIPQYFDDERAAHVYCAGYELSPRYALPKPAPVSVPEWQPIETAPIEVPVVVAGHNFGTPARGRHYCIAKKTARGAWEEVSEWNEQSTLQYLTHWMPLPDAPQPKENHRG